MTWAKVSVANGSRPSSRYWFGFTSDKGKLYVHAGNPVQGSGEGGCSVGGCCGFRAIGVGIVCTARDLTIERYCVLMQEEKGLPPSDSDMPEYISASGSARSFVVGCRVFGLALSLSRRRGRLEPAQRRADYAKI